MMSARAQTLAFAGRKEDAIKVYGEVINDPSTHSALRKKAEAAVKELLP